MPAAPLTYAVTARRDYGAARGPFTFTATAHAAPGRAGWFFAMADDLGCGEDVECGEGDDARPYMAIKALLADHGLRLLQAIPSPISRT